MSAEQPSIRDRIERQLTDYAIEAVQLGKLALLRGVLKLVGDPELPEVPPGLIPPQNTYQHGEQENEQQLHELDILRRCDFAFTAATSMQLATENIILKPSNVYGVPSEYMAVSGPHKPKLFLHRPALDSEDQTQFPYWFGEETVSNDIETGLPTLHYRQIVIDKLGNFQAREWIEGDKQVIRPLDTYESIPYLEVLKSLVIHPIAGTNEKADTH